MKAHITNRDVDPEDESSSPRLVVRFDGQVVQGIAPADELCIGRAKDNDLKISDAKAARHHARLYWDGSRYQIADLDSATGTWINGIRLIGCALVPERGADAPSATQEFGVPRGESQFSTGPAACRLEATLDDLELAPLPSLPDSWEATRHWRLAARLMTLMLSLLPGREHLLLGAGSISVPSTRGAAGPMPAFR